MVSNPDNPSQCDDVCNTFNVRDSVYFTKSTNSGFYQVMNRFLLHKK